MFPGIDGFAWDAGHIIFLGTFYAVLLVVLATVVRALVRAREDLRSHRVDEAAWHADFEELPATLRRCRHELAGDVRERTCENRFDCRRCADHARFVAARDRGPEVPLEGYPRVAGFELPADRLYHRGHTWVIDEDDGTVTVGLDDLGAHLMGTPEERMLPAVGSRLVANGTGWRVRKNGVTIRVLAPVDGEVVAVGGPEDRWTLKIRPEGDRADTRHLLNVGEARGWMLREVERLQVALSGEAIGAALADGGTPVDDLSHAIPPDRWDDLCGMVFLEP